MAKKEAEGKSSVKFHEGQAMLRLAGTYSTLLDVVMESTQNGIDAGASNIRIEVDRSKRTVLIFDDGDGVDIGMFGEALGSIGQTIKRGNKLGRFGLGLISPLGKCEEFSFTSIRKGKVSGFITWDFSTEAIGKQKEIWDIPYKCEDRLMFSRKKAGRVCKSGEYVSWRTRVEIRNYSTDRTIGRISMQLLQDGILDQYGPTIRKKKIMISVKVVGANGEIEGEQDFTAEDFTGKQLPEMVFNDDSAGQVIFKLFITRRGGKKGKIFLGEMGDEFRFPVNNLLRTSSNCISADVAEILRSGVFEGEILAEKCRLLPSRKNFETDDALIGLFIAIEDWYRKCGGKVYEDIKEQRTENRYQELGIRSLKAIAGMVSELSKFKDLIGKFRVGSIGIGHAIPNAKVDSEQKKDSKSITGTEKVAQRSEGQGKIRNFPPAKEKEGHNSFSVQGPSGNKRTRVYNNSLGIQLGHDALATRALWEFDTKEGILILNTMHPHWDECDINDTTLMRYQEFLIMQALNVELQPQEWRAHSMSLVRDLTDSFVFMLLNSDRLANRGAAKARKTRVASEKKKVATA